MATGDEQGPERVRYNAIAEQLVHGHAGVVSTKMFGMPTLKVGGKAFAGFATAAMAFKLTGAAHARAMGLEGARVFDPSGMGRPMKQWVEVPYARADEWEALAEQALTYVSGGA
jgi:hypothetical protein